MAKFVLNDNSYPTWPILIKFHNLALYIAKTSMVHQWTTLFFRYNEPYSFSGYNEPYSFSLRRGPT